MSSIQEKMKVLEIDLIGYDLMTGIKPVFKAATINMLKKNGVNSVGSSNSMGQGTASGYVHNHIKNSKNYIVFSEYPMLEAQQTNTMDDTNSLIFYFYRSPNNNRSIYLELESVKIKSKHELYNGVGKISVDMLDMKIKKEKIKYKSRSEHFHVLSEIKGYGTKIIPQQKASSRQIMDLTKRDVKFHNIEPVKRAIKFNPAAKIISPDFEVRKIRVKARDIPDLFIIPDFQRKRYEDYSAGIFKAIATNKFFSVGLMSYVATDPRDNRDKDVIIDGQQRLSELYNVAMQIDPNLEYNFAIITLPEDVGREAFQLVNRAKKMLTTDHIHSLDDGTIPIIKVLDSLGIGHYSNKTINSSDVLRMYDWGVNKVRDTAFDTIIEMPRKMNMEVSLKIGTYLKVDKSIAGSFEKKNILNKPIVIKNGFRVYYEKDLSDSELAKILMITKENLAVHEISRNKGPENYKMMYDKIKTIAEHVQKGN